MVSPVASGWKPNPRAKARFKDILKALPEEAAKGAEDALRQNGEEAKRIIRGDAPVEDGELRDSVDWSYGEPPANAWHADTSQRTTNVPDRLRLSVYAGGKKAPHGHLVHNGTGQRSTKDGARRGVMPPQPFFWPNIRSLRKRMKARISRKANKAIRDSVK